MKKAEDKEYVTEAFAEVNSLLASFEKDEQFVKNLSSIFKSACENAKKEIELGKKLAEIGREIREGGKKNE